MKLFSDLGIDKEHLPHLIPYVLLLAVGIVVGFKMAPTKVETHETVKTVTDTKSEEILKQLESLQVQITKVMDEQKNTKLHIETVLTTNKDGSSVKKVTEDKNITDVVHTAETKTEVKVVEVEKQVVVVQHDLQIVDKTTKPVLPQWQLGLHGGLAFAPGRGMTVPVGLEGGHRFIGPFWLGGSVDTNTSFNAIQAQVRAWVEF